MGIGKVLAQRIDEIINQKHLTAYAVTKKATVGKSVIYHLRSGHIKSLSISTLLLVCYGLGVTATEFFDSPLFEHSNLEL